MAATRVASGRTRGTTCVRTNRASGPSLGDELERAVGAGDEALGKCASLGFIRIEHAGIGSALHHCSELPRQVDRIADAGVHPLAADRAVNVRGVAGEECAALPEVGDDAMVDVIRGEPVDALDVDAEMREHLLADVVPGEPTRTLRRLGLHGADEPRLALAREREHCEEIRFVERHVQLVIHDGAGGLRVGDVEDVRVGAAGKRRAEDLAHPGAGAVASDEPRRFARFLRAVGTLQPRGDAVAVIVESNELQRPLDIDAGRVQVLDQQALVLVLRKDHHEGERADAGAHRAELHVRHFAAANPEIDSGKAQAACHHIVGDADFAIELERAGVNDERARGRARLGHLVDDAHAHAIFRKPQREHEAGGAGAGDQDIGIGHGGGNAEFVVPAF